MGVRESVRREEILDIRAFSEIFVLECFRVDRSRDHIEYLRVISINKFVSFLMFRCYVVIKRYPRGLLILPSILRNLGRSEGDLSICTSLIKVEKILRIIKYLLLSYKINGGGGFTIFFSFVLSCN